MCYDCLTQIQPWKTLEIYKNLALTLKEKPDLPSYIFKISEGTSLYEKKIRELWDEFKKEPSDENAKRFANYLKEYSSEIWYTFLLDILGVDELSDAQKDLLKEKLEEHHDYIENSLFPDILKELAKGREAFDNFDYRVIFLYSGALWSLGMLGTVMFDGTSIRDLADVFIFMGPKDENTCTGERGCYEHANKMYTVAEILARDIIPGHFRCLTSCRHMLVPVISPLKG